MSKKDAAAIPAVNVRTKLSFSKQTKHKVVFASDEGPVSAVYVEKDAFPTGVIPAHVTLYVNVEDGVPAAGEVEFPPEPERDEDESKEQATA